MADKENGGSRQFSVLPVDGPALTLRADRIGYDGKHRLIVLKLADHTIVGAFPMENTQAVFEGALAKGKK